MDAAVLGIACRLPGAPDIDAFWQLLAEGRCTVGRVPTDRFETARYEHPDRSVVGTAVTFAAGVIDDPWGFDPAFFGLSPREALQMDPQQRVLLQVVWEALEDACIPASSLAGTNTAVFVGASASDYMQRFMFDHAAIDMQVMTGNTLSVIANRISYVLNLRGPSFTVDTACSSSLVALHQAMEAIRAGRIDTAIVAGVNLLLSPFSFVGFSIASMLSATGLCRPFDAGGDGYVRAEGAVAIVLKAVRSLGAADRPRALVVATGTNADGRTVGLSLPSTESQAALLESVYRGIDPDDLAFIEAHGTGTRVGDPAEAFALGRTLGKKRRAPLPIGSAKSNIGHTEPVAGLVGLAKAVLALEHDVLPATLHIETPNPDIPFDDLNLDLARTARPLARGRPRLAGVNSFGFGGANAHAVLTDPPPRPPVASEPTRLPPLVLSAQSEASLKALAATYRDALRNGERTAADGIVRAAAYSRDRLAYRLVAREKNPAQLADRLDTWLAGEAGAATTGRAVASRAQVAFVFSGNGSQWAGMGRTSYQRNAVFRAAFERVDHRFMSRAGWSLLLALWSEDLEAELERTEVAQPLLFAVQVGLVEALKAAGLRPDAVVGHSVGEVAAAWASGALTLDDAVRVIHARSTNQEVIRELGGMAALLLSEADARAALADPAFAAIEIAAINSPRGVTVSGPSEALDDFLAAARGRRWPFKRLDLAYPFHSRLVEPIRGALLGSLVGLKPVAAKMPFVSSVTGAVVAGEALDPAYWWENVRQPVAFSAAIAATAALGPRVFVEIGPRPVLTTYIKDTLSGGGAEIATVASLDRAGEGTDTDPIPAIVDRAFTAGAGIDDGTVFGPRAAAAVRLPHYPWQNLPYRVEATPAALPAFQPDVHPLLGIHIADDLPCWTKTLDPATMPWLADHRVGGTVVLPAAGFAEMALAAAAIRFAIDGKVPALELSGLDILAPLVLEASHGREVRTRWTDEGGLIEIASRPRFARAEWTLHARGRVIRAAAAEPPQAAPAAEGGAQIAAETIYAAAARIGLDYGPTFRRIAAVTTDGEGRATATIVEAAMPPDDAFHLAPAILDGVFHALIALAPGGLESAGRALLPVRIGALRVLRHGATPSRADIAIRRSSTHGFVAEAKLIDAAGAIVATVGEVRFRAVTLSAREAADDLVWRLVAQKRPALPRLGDTEAGEIVATLVAKATAAGLVVASPPPPSAARLLVDAAFRAVASAAAQDIRAAAKDDDASRGPLASRILAFDEDEVSEEGPPLDLVLRTVLSDHPDRVAEAAVVAHLAATLPASLATGQAAPPLSAALRNHHDTVSPGQVPLDAAVVTLLAGMAAPSTLLALSARSARTALALVNEPGWAGTTVVVTDPDDAQLDPLRVRHAGNAAVEILPWSAAGLSSAFADMAIGIDLAAAAIPVEAVLAVARGALMPTGCLVIADPGPSLALDLMRGAAASWWVDTVDPALPIGAARSAGEWVTTLKRSGFPDADARWIADAETHGILAVASRGPAIATAATDRSVLVLSAGGPDDRLATAIAGALRARAVGNVRVEAADPRRIGEDATDIVVAPTFSSGDAASTAGRLDRLATVARLIERPAKVWLVTRGGLAALLGDDGAEREAIIPGFARVLRNERPDIDVRVLDAGRSGTDIDAADLIAGEILAGSDEIEVMLDKSHRVVPRLAHRLPPQLVATSEQTTVALASERRGTLDGLVWRPSARRFPAAGEIEIAVAATGLNFRDVMWAQGLLPEEALEDGYAGATLGMECAGHVARVGEGVAGFAVGDRVVALAPAAFAGHVTIDALAAAKVPDWLKLEAAATVPIAFLTTHYALDHLARLGPGEIVLVHGGAGGVGLAALQLAKHCGATVFATAGSPEKRALLERLGADLVMSSRDLGFADAVMAATGGSGVDVVLNSLSGEAMERSLACLKPFGRFVELGKRDFYADTRIGLRPMRRNISYFGVDADQLLAHRRMLALNVFGEVMRLFADGVVSPLPYRQFAGEDVVDAYRLMQQSAHIGKIIVSPPRRMALPTSRQPFSARSDRRYLVIGGLGGFGLATARWLVARGARHLVLAGRSGAASEAAAAAVQEMLAAGIDVEVAAVDAADRSAMGNLLARLEALGPPLGGVIHAAMVLDDSLVASMTRERIERVLRPKVEAAEVVDALTRDRDLDLFVLFSSATTIVGNPGQAAYVAANAVLEGLARRRRSEGRAGLAVAWGALSDVGALVRDQATARTLGGRLGRTGMTAAEALEGLDLLLASDQKDPALAAVGFGRIDWTAAKRELAIIRTPLFRTLGPVAASPSAGDDAEALRAELAGLGTEAAGERLADILATEIGRILRLPPESIARHRPLSEIGMDSLMALELKMSAEQRLGIEIPLMSVANGATLAELAGRVARRLVGGDRETAQALSRDQEALAASHLEISGLGAGEVASAATKVGERAERLKDLLS